MPEAGSARIAAPDDAAAQLGDEATEGASALAPAGLARTAHAAAVTIIAIVVTVFAIRAAAAFLIPLLLSIFLSYALAPIVSGMRSIGVPRVLGSALAVTLVVSALAAAAYRVGNDASDVLEQIPAAVQRLRLSLVDAQQRQGAGALEHVQRTATELEKLANAAAPAPATPATPAARATRANANASMAPRDHGIDFRSILLLGTSNAVIAVGQLLSALALTFLLLAAGDRFRRKLIGALGPSIARRRTALRILAEIDTLNRRYFAVVLGINVAVGVATGLALHAIGLERPAVWGIGAAVLHSIPYVGSALIGAAAALVAYGQFGSMQLALAAGALPILAAAVLGIGVQTWLMGRATRMSAPAVFVSLLFWGMVWGAWGLLLAVPIMVAAKTACDHIKRLKPIGAMLGP